MNLVEMSGLAVKHVQSAAAEELYLATGYDATKPVTFYGLVNERCNVKCQYCEYWRLPVYKDEMTIAQWEVALLSVKEFVGTFSINFSGGEPFIKPGFLDLMAFCHANGIRSGVTTNGSALNRKNAAKLAEARPFNLNVSVDAPCDEVHDELRGWPGLFQKLSDGIRYADEERDKRGLDFPILVKTTVTRKNYKYMPEMVAWVKEMGATAYNFQPVDRWTPETYGDLWINEDEHDELRKVIDELVALKKAGAPIMPSEMVIGLMIPHFREESAPKETLPCRIGLRDFFIRVSGDVQPCYYYPPIGNIKEQSARDIWYGPKAQEIRKKTVECDRLCLYTCLSQKTIGDKVKMGLTLLKNKPKARAVVDTAPELPVLN